ncbi:hypothetical protein K488DRAFT_87270 [Vararia minispora EC-137]|uniref:Uncharacterized protein n=1 Tax=Vararia minispora EC-137 TaxID=1314806 RepID=A0ACB8QH37_9AGAM|nr:hypothetical protein K488DRAFT_87270 [Vararia minispora EC-137]
MPEELTALRAATEEMSLRAVPVVVESMLFGIFTVLVALSIFTLIQRGLHTWSSGVMFAATLFMYSVSTAYLAVDLWSFINAASEQMENDATQMIHLYDVRSKILTVCLGLNFLLSDGIVLWRAAAFWVRRKLVNITCAVLFLILIVFGILDLSTDQSSDKLIPDSSFIVPEPTKNQYGAICILISLLANVWALLLIALKALNVSSSRHKDRQPPSPYTSALPTYSGTSFWLWLRVLHILGMAFFIAVSITDSAPGPGTLAHLTLDSAVPQITGIYPTAIIVLVSFWKQQAGDNADDIESCNIRSCTGAHSRGVGSVVVIASPPGWNGAIMLSDPDDLGKENVQ